jgi:hypothetical protein
MPRTLRNAGQCGGLSKRQPMRWTSAEAEGRTRLCTVPYPRLRISSHQLAVGTKCIAINATC